MHDAAQFLIRHGYAVLFAGVFIEQVGLPVPSLPFLLAPGALAGGLDAWRARGFPLSPPPRP